MKELDDSTCVPCSFFSNKTDVQFSKQFFTGFFQAYLLIKDKSVFLTRRDFLTEGKGSLFYDHPTRKPHLHFDGEEGEHEVKGLLFFLFAHFQHQCVRLTLYKQYRLAILLQRTHPFTQHFGFTPKNIAIMVDLRSNIRSTIFEYFFGLTKPRYYNLKVPRKMQKKKVVKEILPKLLGKHGYFRSRSNTRLHDQDHARFSEFIGSTLHRNRSLKQLFGQLPTIIKNKQPISSYICEVNLQIQQNSIIEKEQKKTVNTLKKRQIKMEDEYLLRKPRRKQRQGDQKQSQLRQEKEELGYKRKNKNPQQLILKNDNNLKMQPYNPAAYNWRNTSSKEKNDKLSKHSLTSRIPALVQSQYFPSLNKSDKNQIKETEIKKCQQSPKQLSRSNSSDSVRKLGLRPRVIKHIFEQKSPGRKQGNHSKRKENLLFTFGFQ